MSPLEILRKWADLRANRRTLARFRVRCAEPPTIYGRLLIADFSPGWTGSITLGRRVVICSSFEANPVGGTRTAFVLKGPEARIEIGDGSGMSNALIAAYESVVIGKDVNIGAGAKIMDTDFHPLDLDERIRNVNIPHRPVRLEDGVFVGTNAIILKGVTVGAESVIAAGAVVAKSVPPGEIWGGNPARFIKKLKP
jgi:acetyltransferase-like isoleucine patch superfamily enzyme